MKQKNIHLKNFIGGIIFLTGVAMTDQIDAEIVKNLDFYSDMDMVENMEQYQNPALNEEKQVTQRPPTETSPMEKTRE